MAHAVTEGHERISIPGTAKGRVDVYLTMETHADAPDWTAFRSHVYIHMCRTADTALMGDLASPLTSPQHYGAGQGVGEGKLALATLRLSSVDDF